MFSALRAEIGDWQRRVFNPSNDVSRIGYALKIIGKDNQGILFRI